MISTQKEYIDLLREHLEKNSNKEEILLEYEVHLAEMHTEIYSKKQISEQEAMKLIIERFGLPEEIAEIYKEESAVTAEKTKWLFFISNLFFFISGVGLTVIYHQLSNPSIHKVWAFLTSIPFTIICLYCFFWLLLGYEVGKEFGLGGRKLLQKTFSISLIPNLLLMVLIVFQIIPISVFDPLLSEQFIFICIGATFFLYPITVVGFRFGTTKSV
ncbi:hypothetical protein [Niallia sp. NCCP-28]|uniref:HAAS signaling domain-containing protein n=1 Tax=Niallia sp. NCCP-28 TaxID=2934712 RepID=UPI0020884CE3|nr:hypothetical protein [Niallia sp. NCCP-28]GKU80734.1 hypothetical protein NCCP28_01300 [Niallia sp. NCCP-28]